MEEKQVKKNTKMEEHGIKEGKKPSISVKGEQ